MLFITCKEVSIQECSLHSSNDESHYFEEAQGIQINGLNLFKHEDANFTPAELCDGVMERHLETQIKRGFVSKTHPCRPSPHSHEGYKLT
jgi:hypothetical protein